MSGTGLAARARNRQRVPCPIRNQREAFVVSIDEVPFPAQRGRSQHRWRELGAPRGALEAGAGDAPGAAEPPQARVRIR